MAHLDYTNGYYEGDVNYNDEEHGYGTFVWDSGDRYTGEWRNGEKHGHGTCRFADGTCYDGEWRNDVMCGHGTYRFANGNYYIGNFANDHYYGRGTWYQDHGNVSYEGNWIDDENATDVTETDHGKRRHGKIVDDSFEEDPLNGYAREDYSNGYYEGNFLNGKRHGKGKYCWADGDSYDGEWRNGDMNGHGVKKWTDGAYYEGEWRDDNRSGQGTMHYSDGAVYTGQWSNDKNNGRGTLKFSNGTYYEGEFRNDEFCGRGTLHIADGAVFSGTWTNSGNADSVICTTTSERLGMPGKIVDGEFIPSGLPKREETEKPTDKKRDYGEYSYNLGEYSITYFGGKKVYYKNGLFSFSKENLDEMKKGNAPIGADGYRIELHHTTQMDDSPIVELLYTVHKGYTRTLHNPYQEYSGIGREAFASWRHDYWKYRADEYFKKH